MFVYYKDMMFQRKEKYINGGIFMKKEKATRKKKSLWQLLKRDSALDTVCASGDDHHIYLHLHSNVWCPDCIQKVQSKAGIQWQPVGGTETFYPVF